MLLKLTPSHLYRKLPSNRKSDPQILIKKRHQKIRNNLLLYNIFSFKNNTCNFRFI